MLKIKKKKKILNIIPISCHIIKEIISYYMELRIFICKSFFIIIFRFFKFFCTIYERLKKSKELINLKVEEDL